MIDTPTAARPSLGDADLHSRAGRICRRHALLLLRRDHRKYARILAAIHLGHWRVARWRVRVLRACYFYFRLLDDVADGDRECEKPEELLDEQCARWTAGAEASREDDANLLFDFLWAGIANSVLDPAELRGPGASLVAGLRWDFLRRRERYVPTRRELDHYYAQVVLAPAELACVILGGSGSPPAAHALSLLIGRLQSARDLYADRAAGLINIPREDGINATPRELEAWRQREMRECIPRLAELWTGMQSAGDWRCRLVFGSAVKTLQNWARKGR